MTIETSSLTHTNANNTASASGSRQGLPQHRQQAYVAPVISVEQRSDSSSLTDANEYTSNVFREQERGGYKRMQRPQRNRGGGKPEEGNGSIPEQRAVASGPQHSQDEEETSSPSFKDRISRFGAPPPKATSKTTHAAGVGRQWQQQQQPAAAPPWAKPKSHTKPEPQRKTPSGGDGGSPFSVRLRPGSSAQAPAADDDGGDNGNPFQVRLRKTGVKPASKETERNEAKETADAGTLISTSLFRLVNMRGCLVAHTIFPPHLFFALMTCHSTNGMPVCLARASIFVFSCQPPRQPRQQRRHLWKSPRGSSRGGSSRS